MEIVSQKTYLEVMRRDNARCQHPNCGIKGVEHFTSSGRVIFLGVEYHHILFRSLTSGLTDDPRVGIVLCPWHHRLGPEAAHNSEEWKQYYYQFLPKELLEKYGKMAKSFPQFIFAFSLKIVYNKVR